MDESTVMSSSPCDSQRSEVVDQGVDASLATETSTILRTWSRVAPRCAPPVATVASDGARQRFDESGAVVADHGQYELRSSWRGYIVVDRCKTDSYRELRPAQTGRRYPLHDSARRSIIDPTDVNPVLNAIMLAELAGVIRYTHYSLVITGPNRLPLVTFMQEQADESLTHARQAGEILTGLGGHPTQGIGPIEESHDHSIEQILRESIADDNSRSVSYRQLLGLVEHQSIYLEEYARNQIGSEELHVIEMNKPWDYTIA